MSRPPSGRLYANTAGTRGLGTAGSGDALAGEVAAREIGEDGLLATDVVDRLPTALRALRAGRRP